MAMSLFAKSFVVVLLSKMAALIIARGLLLAGKDLTSLVPDSNPVSFLDKRDRRREPD